ncbi:MAG: type II toxin-antitoxin system RatA family toxin [Magnetococcales bacterium]|nr:type II toxin-antitoxin system RatA family toxin [Magnetococcales bacterium]
MPRITLTENVKFSCEQMYGLVVDVDRYPEFLPWCVAARRYDDQEGQFMAELTVSFKGIRESFRTQDRYVPNKRVDIALRRGPFRHLESSWVFAELPNGNGARVDFSIDFQFKSRLMNMTIGPVFTHAAKQMVSAFRKRANMLYP